MFRKGFTLIELLVVMTIIGLLAGILMPNISAAQNRAKETAVKAVLHNVQAEVEGYQIDNYSYPSGDNLTLAELTLQLNLKSFKNPFTGKNYGSADKPGQIFYKYDEATGSYLLTACRRDGTPLLELTNS